MKKEKILRPSYLKGLGGAALGGFIAFLMWIMVAHFVGGNLHLSFGFVLALFLYYGYFSMGGKKAKGFYAVFLPLLFCIGFLATAVSFGVIHMNGLGFTGENIGIYASAYYGGNVFIAYMDTLAGSIWQVIGQFSTLWPYFAISAIYEAVGAMCYGVRAGRMMIEEVQEENKKQCKEVQKKEEGHK